MDSLAGSWSQWVVIGEVAAAMALGGVIGFEREVADRPAGLRTHMLIAGACALIVGLGGAMLEASASSTRSMSQPIRSGWSAASSPRWVSSVPGRSSGATASRSKG